MQGRCDCGAVTVTLPGPPDRINACACAYCRRVGARWGYFPADAVQVDGNTQAYRRDARIIEFRRCATCGVLIQWIDPDGKITQTGIHMANFAPDALADIPVVAS